MKVIRIYEFGGPEVMKLEDVPDPKPSPGQVLVRLHAAGVNPVDTYVRAGTYTIRATLPFTPGSDGAGVIEAVGDGVKQWKGGDRVYIFGTTSGVRAGAYAELAVCATSQVHSLADNATYAKAQPSACRTAPLIGRFSKKPKPFPARRFSFTVPAVAWASRRCNLPSRTGCA